MQPDLSHLHEPIPVWLSGLFALLVVVLLFGIYYIVRPIDRKQTPFILTGCIVWLSLLYGLAQQSFFLEVAAVPPRLFLAVVPPLLLIAGLFTTKSGRQFIDRLSLRQLTWVHTIRVGVELLLFELFVAGQIPQAMTFEGRNWDILAGLTAPIVGLVGFSRKKWPSAVLLWWNVLALGLLINIVATAVFAAPFPFQQLSFDQPNVGVLKPSFVWLPGFVVPVVLFCHLVAIRQLWRQRQ